LVTIHCSFAGLISILSDIFYLFLVFFVILGLALQAWRLVQIVKYSPFLHEHILTSSLSC